jgi:hypothetical protein
MAVERRLTSRYKTGRLLARIISFFGWIVVALSIVLAILFVIGLVQKDTYSDHTMVLGMAGLTVGTILAGIILIAIGQMLRATLDTADHTRQMLDIMQR